MEGPRGRVDIEERRRAVQRLMDDVRGALAAGRSVNEHAIVAAHPELMPELGEAFAKLWKGRAGKDAARVKDGGGVGPVGERDMASGDQTVAAGGLGDTMTRPGRQRSEKAVDPEVTLTRTRGKGSVDGDGLPALSEELGETVTRGGDGEETETFSAAEATAREGVVPGVQIPGYSIQREISRGGQAVVFLAIQLSTGRKVAAKVMRHGPLADERSMTRFQREVQILAALDHPNIVSILDTGKTADGSQYITMPYIAGSTLDDYMKRRQSKDADPGKLLRAFYKICLAVNEAHLRGIVHRDLKPSNIRVDERGEPHVLDFGLARTALDRFIRGSNEPLSVSGEFLGSLPWSSPEQAEGDPEKIDLRTDVYSLGVILYQMLTGGKFPYEVVGNIRDVLNNILTAEPTPPSKIMAAAEARATQAQRQAPARPLPVVNEAIERIVLKALSKRKEMRYQSAGELGKDVARYLLGKPTGAGAAGKAGMAKGSEAGIAAAGAGAAEGVRGGWSGGKKAGAVVLGMAILVMVGVFAWSKIGGKKSELATEETVAATGVAEDGAHGDSRPTDIVPASGSKRVDLLKLVALEQDSVAGMWALRDGTLKGGQGIQSRVEFPYEPPQEYDYRIVFSREEGQGGIAPLMVGSGRQFEFLLGGFANTIAGFALVNGQNPNQNRTTERSSGWLVNGRKYTLLMKVRRGGVEAYLDGAMISSITTDFAEMSLNPNWGLKHANAIGFLTTNCAATVYAAEVEEIGGTGTLLRPRGAALASVDASDGSAGAATRGVWVRLFDGSDFAGWNGRGGGNWTVAQGVMEGRGYEGRGRGGASTLSPVEQFQDFRLRVTTMRAEGEGGSIRFMVPIPAGQGRGFITPRFTVRIGGTNPGAALDTGTIYVDTLVKGAAKPVAIAPNAWFTLEIMHKGAEVSVSINGQEVSHYTDIALVGPKGDFHFISYNNSTVRFKDVQIMNLNVNPDEATSRPALNTSKSQATQDTTDTPPSTADNTGTLSSPRPVPSSPNGQLAYGINGGTVSAYLNGKPLPVAQGFNLQVLPVKLVPGDRIVFRATGNGQGWKAIGFAFNGTGDTPSFYSTANASTVRDLPAPESTPIPTSSQSTRLASASDRLPGRVIQNAGNFKLDDHIEWLRLDGPGCSEFFFTVPGAVSNSDSANGVRLFNGKDLTGWLPSTPASWSVQNGAIEGRGTAKRADGRGGGESLQTTQLFQNFHLRFSAMAAAGAGGAIQFIVPSNPGVQAPETVQRNHVIAMKIFVDGSDTVQRTGNIMVDGIPKQTAKPVPRPSDKYFSVDITHSGDTVSVSVNDEFVTRYSDPKFNARGYIYFEVGSESLIHYKDITIQQLGTIDKSATTRP